MRRRRRNREVETIGARVLANRRGRGSVSGRELGLGPPRRDAVDLVRWLDAVHFRASTEPLRAPNGLTRAVNPLCLDSRSAPDEIYAQIAGLQGPRGPGSITLLFRASRMRSPPWVTTQMSSVEVELPIADLESSKRKRGSLCLCFLPSA